MKVVIIDCYDSFTYNLSQLVGRLGHIPVVLTCDATLGEVSRECPDRIILSPGPGTPEDSGICPDVIRTFSRTIPTLGVCLGHQVICSAFGGTIIRNTRPVHGKTSLIHHDGKGVFSGLENPFIATRYHSLIAGPGNLPADLVVTAISGDDGAVMGLRHRTLPIEGVQFHPESILTPSGDRILENFISGPGDVEAGGAASC